MKEKILGLITHEEAKELHHNWLKNRAAIIEKAREKKESYEVNFSAKELLKYLNHVVKASEKQGLKDPGIRIYFALYEEKEALKSRENATVVLMPTEQHNTSSKCNSKIKALNRANTGWPPVGL